MVDLKIIFHDFRFYCGLVRRDIKNIFRLGAVKRLWLWRQGFLSEKLFLYGLTKSNVDDYMSDYHASRARWLNDPFTDILTNKFIFECVVSKFIRVPETFGIFVNGRYQSYNGKNLEKLMYHFERLVLKSVGGGGGKGVFIVEREDFYFKINGNVVSKEELFNFVSTLHNFICSDFIEPSHFSRSLHEGTINTIRLITLIDQESNEPFIAAAVQRIGSSKTLPMDNFTKGGLSCNIDLETGRLSSLASYHPNSSSYEMVDKHPDTNLCFSDKVIPNWDAVKKEILYAASMMPMLVCIGWDLLLSEDGLVAIEGNHHPDPDVIQGHFPLFKNARVKNFYINKNII